MSTMMQQIPERSGKERRKKNVEIREIACGPARKQKYASTNMLTTGIGLLRQASVDKFSNAKTHDRVTEIVHGKILHGFLARSLHPAIIGANLTPMLGRP